MPNYYSFADEIELLDEVESLFLRENSKNDNDVENEDVETPEMILQETDEGYIVPQDLDNISLENKDEGGNDENQENEEELVDENNNQDNNEDEEIHGIVDENINNKDEDLILNEEEKGGGFTNFNIEKTETTLEIMSDTYSATIQGNSGNMNDFSWNDITIGDYVIMDRNLGATEPWDGTTFVQEYLPSYGYLYQWGNNYGFAPGETIINNSSRVTVAPQFIPSMYSSSTFVKQNNTNWNNDATATDALWGYGAQYLFDRDRQGPCPDGYHVPSKSEWDGLFNYWKTWPDRSTSEANKQKNFIKDLLLPGAGYINGNNVTFTFDGNANYFSSTPNSATQAYTLTYSSSNGNDPKTEGKGRSNGRSVRCFKDTNEAYRVIFTSVNGLMAPAQSVAKGGTFYATKPVDPIRLNSEFIGWYKEDGTEFDFENTPIIDDITLYAKWNCKYGLVESEDGKYCEGETTITFDANGGTFSGGTTQKIATYTLNASGLTSDTNIQFPNRSAEGETGYMFDKWYTDTTCTTERDGINTEIPLDGKVYANYLPFKDLTLTMSGVTFTIMDRNLGAINVGTGCNSSDTSACGYYFQRGNNYGFRNVGKYLPYSSSDLVDASEYGPGNYYSNAIFITTNNLGWDSSDNGNLWGGEYQLLSDNVRQGPCPEGYHIPTATEWSKTFGLFNARKATTEGIQYCNLVNSDDGQCFSAKARLPLAGRRYTNTALDEQNKYWFYWSSTRYDQNNAYRISIGSDITKFIRAYAFSLRCFKNTGKPIQFETNGGALDTQIEVNKRWWEDAIELDAPTKENYYFGGWYTTPDFQSGTKVETNDIDTADDTVKLYAKWNDLVVNFDTNRGTYINSQGATSGDMISRPEDPLFPGYNFEGWYEDKELTREFNFSTLITGNTTIYAKWSDYIYPFDDLELYFIDSTGELNHFTMMDRNMGATEVYNGEFSTGGINTGSFGYHYQWGNNYGFEPCYALGDKCSDFPGGENTTKTKVPYETWSKYKPSTYARNIFVISRTNWMDGSSTGDNIRGGAGDTLTGNGIGTKLDRQGPCPEGYYIPSTYDWFNIHSSWKNSNTSTSDGKSLSYDLLLPPAGYRHYQDYTVRNQGIDGNSFSSSPFLTNVDRAYDFTFTISSSNPQNDLFRPHGRTIRCVKNNSNNKDFTIHTNGGKNATIIFTGNVGEGRFTTLSEPVRDSGTFGGWYSDKNYQNQVHTGDIVPSNLYAKWNCDTGYVDDGEKCIEKKTDDSGSKSSGAGKKTPSTDKSETKNSDKSETHNSAESTTQNKTKQDGNSQSWNNNYSNLDIERYNVSYSTEQNEAYQFAYANGVTTMSTIQTANMNGKLTRIQMAKMLSNYAINVLGQELDLSKGAIEFKDITKELDEKYDCGVTLAYQLGIMGINMKNNKFRPYDEVTRAEFATALSRLLYGTSDGEHKSTAQYYTNHIEKLKKEGIITKDNPKMKELRGYVMIMLMRSVK